MIFTKPSSIHGSITERCNMRCRNCDWWQSRNERPEATIAQWIEFVQELRAWLGPFEFHLAGGEPFLKPGLLELIRACSAQGVKTYLTTNGTLINRAVAEELADSGLWCLNVSLDFLDRERQDWLKGISGTADKIHRALDLIDETRKAAYNVALATVVMKQNLRELPGIVEFARGSGYYLGFQVIFQNFGAPYNPMWYQTSEFWPDDLGLVSDMMDYLISQKAQDSVISNSVAQLKLMTQYFTNPNPRPEYVCRVGDKMLAFNPYGDLALCFNTKPIGTIHDHKLKLTWYGLTAQKRRNQISKCRRQCALLNCHFEE